MFACGVCTYEWRCQDQVFTSAVFQCFSELYFWFNFFSVNGCLLNLLFILKNCFNGYISQLGGYLNIQMWHMLWNDKCAELDSSRELKRQEPVICSLCWLCSSSPCWNATHRCQFQDLSLTHTIFRVNCQRPQMLFGESPGEDWEIASRQVVLCALFNWLLCYLICSSRTFGFLKSVCLIHSHNKSPLMLLGISSELQEFSIREQSWSIVLVEMKVAEDLVRFSSLKRRCSEMNYIHDVM